MPATTAFFTLHEAQTEVATMADFLGADPDSEITRAAVLLLLGIGRRKHLSDLTRVSQYPKDFVRRCLTNLRDGGVWRGETHGTWAHWECGAFFLLDVMVALGVVKKELKYPPIPAARF